MHFVGASIVYTIVLKVALSFSILHTHACIMYDYVYNFSYAKTFERYYRVIVMYFLYYISLLFFLFKITSDNNNIQIFEQYI